LLATTNKAIGWLTGTEGGAKRHLLPHMEMMFESICLLLPEYKKGMQLSKLLGITQIWKVTQKKR